MKIEDNLEMEAIFLNEIFKKLFGLFPSCYAVFKNKENVENSKREWRWAFLEHGILTKDYNYNYNLMKKALFVCQKLDQPFMPSCGQFILICENIKKQLIADS